MNADVLLVGHTHLPFNLDLGTRLVNPEWTTQTRPLRSPATAVWEDGRIALKSQQYDVGGTVGRMLGLPIDGSVRRQLADVPRGGSPPERPCREKGIDCR